MNGRGGTRGLGRQALERRPPTMRRVPLSSRVCLGVLLAPERARRVGTSCKSSPEQLGSRLSILVRDDTSLWHSVSHQYLQSRSQPPRGTVALCMDSQVIDPEAQAHVVWVRARHGARVDVELRRGAVRDERARDLTPGAALKLHARGEPADLAAVRVHLYEPDPRRVASLAACGDGAAAAGERALARQRGDATRWWREVHHAPQKTAGFGNRESAYGGPVQFRLCSVISAVSHSPIGGGQRHPHYRRLSRVGTSARAHRLWRTLRAGTRARARL